MTATQPAQIVKSYHDGTGEIDTLPIDTARDHVRTRTAAPNAFGITRIDVLVNGTTHTFITGQGWVTA